MKTKSIKGDSPQEIQSALQQSMADGFRPTLAIVFISVKQERKSICEILGNEGVDIVAATSSGELIDGYQGEGSIGFLLKTAGDPDALIMFPCQGREIAFGSYMSDEIDRLKKMWNAPMIGLFSFGEIGRGADGKYDFYNMTCSLAMLKENEN